MKCITILIFFTVITTYLKAQNNGQVNYGDKPINSPEINVYGYIKDKADKKDHSDKGNKEITAKGGESSGSNSGGNGNSSQGNSTPKVAEQTKVSINGNNVIISKYCQEQAAELIKEFKEFTDVSNFGFVLHAFMEVFDFLSPESGVQNDPNDGVEKFTELINGYNSLSKVRQDYFKARVERELLNSMLKNEPRETQYCWRLLKDISDNPNLYSTISYMEQTRSFEIFDLRQMLIPLKKEKYNLKVSQLEHDIFNYVVREQLNDTVARKFALYSDYSRHDNRDSLVLSLSIIDIFVFIKSSSVLSKEKKRVIKKLYSAICETQPETKPLWNGFSKLLGVKKIKWKGTLCTQSAFMGVPMECANIDLEQYNTWLYMND